MVKCVNIITLAARFTLNIAIVTAIVFLLRSDNELIRRQICTYKPYQGNGSTDVETSTDSIDLIWVNN